MNSLIFFIIVLLVLALGVKFKISYGILGLGAAFIVGMVFLDMDYAGIIGLFPTRILFQIMNATIFYGFANSNGTMNKVAGRLVYIFRNQKKFIVLILYAIAIIISALGAGAVSTNIIMGPIAFSVAAQFGLNPIFGPLIACLGASVGDWAPWGASAAWFSSWTGEYIGMEGGKAVVMNCLLWYFIVFTLVIVACFFIFKGYRIKDTQLIVAKPEPLDKKQKLTLALIITMILLIVVPNLLLVALPDSAVLLWMTTYLSVQTLCAIGSVILAFAKAADMKDVLKNQVPWETIYMVCGIATLMAMCEQMGVIEAAQGIISNVPAFLVVGVICLICGILSFFVTGMTVLSLMLALVVPICAATGHSQIALCTAIYIGLDGAGFSPFSMGGSMGAMACPDTYDKTRLANTQMIVAVCIVLTCVVFALIGAYGWGAAF